MSVAIPKEKVSVVTVLHGNEEFIPLIRHNFLSFKDTQELELVVIDDGPTSQVDRFADIPDCLYIHLDQEEIAKFSDQILEGYKQPNKAPLQYQRKLRTLPNGFKRDYGCGLSSHPLIFHMNYDCVYLPKAVDRKVRYMKRVAAECTYCDASLCYDIYNRKLYKTESKHKIYESTLCHTREFWKRRGFQWSDIEIEGKYFHYNNGSDRKMDNYYDTIQLLSILNMNLYHPVSVTIEGLDIDIPEVVGEIRIETHPIVQTMTDLYGQDEIHLLGINSEFLENVSQENWRTFNLTDKWKQTKLAKQIKEKRDSYHVLVYGSKHPAWDLFEHVAFDIIFLETNKNQGQMTSILGQCKNHEYICVKGVFVRKDYLEHGTQKEGGEEEEGSIPK